MKCLFEMTDGNAKITDHVRNIWFYKDIIEKYGEATALKIFKVYHFMADMSLDNPFANENEITKLETILRGVCPELVLQVDWNDPLIEEGIEFTRKLYETPSYRKYLTSKIVFDRMVFKLQYFSPDFSKEAGNSGEVEKAYKVLSNLDEITKKFYNEYLEEQGTIKVRGQGIKTSNKSKNTPRELD